MRGIVLAGGTGSRLLPLTFGVSKHLLPVYDKPMIFYPVSTLMLSKIREILIITSPSEIARFRKLLGDGSHLGVSLSYAIQDAPRGIVEAFTIGATFIGNHSVCLILGDNIFYGQGLGSDLNFAEPINGAHILAYKVSNPKDYGVVQFNSSGRVTSIEEKPLVPKSNFAVPGLYRYDNSVLDFAKEVNPSLRNELEITSLNQLYLEQGLLQVKVLRRGTAWLDAGTFDSLHAASTFVKTFEDRQGLKIACLEEIAWRNNWISDSQLHQASSQYGTSPYGKYIKDLLTE